MQHPNVTTDINRVIQHSYTPRTFAQGWTDAFTAEMRADELIKRASIHEEESVLVDVAQCVLNPDGRTLKEQNIEMYQTSFSVSD